MEKTAIQQQESILIPHCHVAKSFFSRFFGLMGKKTLSTNEAILFPKCNSVHTFFMRFSIDVIFVSADGHVVDIVEGMRPWRILLPRLQAKHTIEMRTERSRELRIGVGSKLDCKGVWT